MTVEANKLNTFGLGRQQAKPLDVPLVIAVHDEQGRTLLRRAIDPAELARPIELTVEGGRPASVMLDPDFSLPTAAAPQRGKRLRDTAIASQA